MNDRSVTDELYEWVHKVAVEKSPFGKVLGLSIESLAPAGIQFKFPMRSELVGNSDIGFLHGGVISGVLDATGSVTAWMDVISRMKGPFTPQRASSIGAITIDLRIDYLRPGAGEYFISSCKILRAGTKIAVTRMELHNDSDQIIAVGTGTYAIGRVSLPT